VKIHQFGTVCARLMGNFANGSKRTVRINRITKQYLSKFFLGAIAMAGMALAFSTSQAALVTYEGFPYPAIEPATIDGKTNGVGWEFGWGGGGLGSASAYSITNAPVGDPSGLLYTFSNTVFSAGGFAGRFFNVNVNSWGNPLTTNYFSIVIKPTVTPATNHFYGLQIYSNGANTGNGVDLLVGKNGSGMNWGLESGIGTDAYSTVAAQANVPVLLVVRVIFNPTGVFGTPDSFALYVNPTPGQPEPAVPSATLMGDIGNQNGIQLDDGNGGAALFDEVRIGATFASVTPTSNNSSDPNLMAWEPFAYNQGFSTGILDGQPNDGTQASNGWDNVKWDDFLFSGETNFTMVAGSLADPSGKLVTMGNSTHAATTNGGFFGTGRFNVWSAKPASTNANPTYYSLLLRVDNLGSTNTGTSGAAYLSIFGQPNANNLLAGYLYGGSGWGIQSSTNQNLSAVPVVSNQTVFLVVRANYAAAGNPSTILLYVNPTPGQPEPATANATNIWTQSAEQNGIALAVENGAAATFDEFRVGTNYADVTPAVAVANNPFNITSIAKTGNDVVLTWNTTAGNTNAVQFTSGSGGNYNTNGFANISSAFVVSGTPGSAVVTNYTDVGGATNQPARYYRVRQIP
jgi:hypothetical protein